MHDIRVVSSDVAAIEESELVFYSSEKNIMNQEIKVGTRNYEQCYKLPLEPRREILPTGHLF